MIPTSILVALHITFKRSIKSGLIKVMFLHGMGSGSCLSYTGLVLPEHTNSNTQLLFLNDSQVVATNYYIDDSQAVLSFQLHRCPRWSHFVLHSQANWFVSVSPLAFCLGVLLSIVASERLGRCQQIVNKLSPKGKMVSIFTILFQEDDVRPQQFHSIALLCSSLFCSKFWNHVRWETKPKHMFCK